MPEREPLWASSLAHQPRRDDDIVATWEREDDEPSPQPPPPATAPPAWVLITRAALVLLVVLPWLPLLAGTGSLLVKDVPSGWSDVPMTCRTTRLEDGARAIELFRCHAVGAGRLPPGLYSSPGDRWTSDITRIDALADAMRISPQGVLTGFAVY